MAVRNFTANNSEVRVPTIAGSVLGADFTLAALVKPNAHADWQALMAGHNSSGTYQWEFGVNPSDLMVLFVANGSQLHEGTGLTLSTTTTWHIVAVTKTGNTTRFHRFLLGGAWSHVASSLGGSHNTPGSTSSGYISVGEAQDVDDLNMRVAVVGVWNAALSDAQVEALATGLASANWVNHAVAPVGVWDYNQATAGTNIPDLKANHATITGTISGATDTNGIAGTAIVTTDDPPSWVFGAGAESHSGSAAITATGQVTATGRKNGVSSAAVTATGQTVAVGRKNALSASAITASGQTVASTAKNGVGTAAVTANGQTVATGTKQGLGAAAITATGNLVATGYRNALGAASIGATGTLTATGGAARASTGAISATGQLAAAGYKNALGAASITATGTTAATGQQQHAASGSAEITATGQLQATGTKTAASTAAVAVTGQTTATGTKNAAGAAAITAAGQLAATGTSAVNVFGAAAITATGILAATYTTGRFATAAVTASGQLVAVGTKTARNVAAISVTGVLAATGTRAGDGGRYGTLDALEALPSGVVVTGIELVGT